MPASKAASSRKRKQPAASKKQAATRASSSRKTRQQPTPGAASDDDDDDDESDFSDLDVESSDAGEEKPLTEKQLKALEPVTKKALSKLKPTKAQKRKERKAAAEKAALARGPSGNRRGKNSAKQDALEKANPKKRGVVYLGHVPYGFFEEQMKAYFSQFAPVTRLKLSRNKKTGKSKHYAHIEFDDVEAARIVAETMNGYMMFGRTLVCQYVPANKCHKDLFKGANRRFRAMPWKEISREQHNRARTPRQQTAREQRLLRKENKRRKALEAAGVSYEFKGIKGLLEERNGAQGGMSDDDDDDDEEEEEEEKVKKVVKKARKTTTGTSKKAKAAAKSKKTPAKKGKKTPAKKKKSKKK